MRLPTLPVLLVLSLSLWVSLPTQATTNSLRQDGSIKPFEQQALPKPAAPGSSGAAGIDFSPEQAHLGNRGSDTTVINNGHGSTLDFGNPDYTDFESGNVQINDAAVASTISAVPEPGIYEMLLAGLGVIAFIALRRRK